MAACFATAQMAKIMDDIPNYIKYTEIGDSARHVYQQKLWNGVYFDYDSSNSGHHDSIMADMLAGQWYCRVCSLPPIASVAQAVSCFRTIYKYNVLGNRDDGLIGAINGMRPNGSIDTSCLQSREVWTGTTYALASAMLLEANILELSMSLDPKTIEVDISNTQSKNYTNDIEETNALVDADLDFRFDETLNIGFGEDNRRGKMRKSRLKNPFKVFGKNKVTEPKALTILEELSSPRGRTSICAELRRMGYATAQGIHDAGWQRYGYWFATPEGWETSGNYRSLGYMRPLAIWAMHYAGDKNSGPVL